MSPGAHTPGRRAPVVLRSPLRLRHGHQAAEVAGRARVTGGHRHRQQSLGRDPALGPGHGLGHQVGHRVVVVADRIDPGLTDTAALTDRFTVFGVVPQISAAAR